MALIKRKKCCIPYCNNVQEISKKQFFKIGANLEGREKWLPIVGKVMIAKSQILFCCEEHFNLPNDAENYIRYKYVPGTKLKLRPNVLPQKKLPLNVCRLCLKLIYNGDDYVEISEKKGGKNAQIIAATLPELDLSITVEPVACVKCFDPLEQYYRIKQNALNSEVIVVNCIKSIVKRSPKRLVENCEIDLFEEYNDIVELLEKEKEKTKVYENPTIIEDLPEDMQDKQETDRNTEELVIDIEEPNYKKYKLEVHENKLESGPDNFDTVPMGESSNTLSSDTHFDQKNLSVIENFSYNKVPGSSSFDNHEKTNFVTKNPESLQNLSNTLVEDSDNVEYYEVVEAPMELSSDNMYIHVEKEASEDVVIVTSQL